MDPSSAPLWVQALVLGLVQGITEFLPVSSSGHLVLVPALTGWTHLGRPFDVALHLGTLLAIVAYFRSEVGALFQAVGELAVVEPVHSDPHRRLVVGLFWATLPAAVVGYFLDDFLEREFGGPASIALFLALFALVLGWAELRGRKNGEVSQLGSFSYFLVGLAQALALVPGVSRCGATMTACLLLGLTRAESARLSFLMALPVTAGALILKGVKLLPQPPDAALLGPCLLGIAVSGLSGWACIHYLLRYLRRHSFRPFVTYRLALSCVLCLWLIAHGVS